MADKEEKIYILSKQFCPSVDGWENAKESSMTRQEAIDIMAKGMCKRATEVIKNNERVVLGYSFYAELALNALLEGVKK